MKSTSYFIPAEMGGPEDGQIPMEDGYFSYLYVPAPGSASLSQFLLYPGVAFGDLNGNSVEDAVVLIINISPGTGIFYHLVPVLNAGGQPQALDATFIGDRVVVEGVNINEGEVHLTYRTYRPEEPFGGTPTLRVARRIALREGTLEQLFEEVLNANEVINETELDQVVSVDIPEEGGIVSFTSVTAPFGLDEYKMPVVAGQAMTITVTAPHQDTFLSIYALDLSETLVSARDEGSSWRGTVSETKEYAINVFSIGSETEYTLTIETTSTPDADASELSSASPAGAPGESSNLVYLTFDDRPAPLYTPEILDLLAQYDARATFFVLGVNGQTYSDLLEATNQAGHTLANHTWNHRSLSGINLAEFNKEIQSTAQLLGSAAAPCVRPPYGAADAFTRAYAAELGYDVIMCNIDTLDWTQPGVQAITSPVLVNIYPGAIVLMHDGGGNRTQTVAALETVLIELNSQGYVFEALCQ